MMQNSTPDHDRNECLKKAESCLKQAGLDVARRTYWITQAAEWISRARGGAEADDSFRIRGNTGEVTHEINDGRLVPKPTRK